MIQLVDTSNVFRLKLLYPKDFFTAKMFASHGYSSVLETGVDSTGHQNEKQNRNRVGFVIRKKGENVCHRQESSAFDLCTSSFAGMV